jgi:hypothetical protein
LYETRTRRQLVEHFAEGEGSWQTAGNIASARDLSRPVIADGVEFLVLAGLVNSKNERRFTQYQLARDSAPYAAVKAANRALAGAASPPPEHNGTPLALLYGSKTRRELVDLFLEAGVGWTDDDDPLSTRGLTTHCGGDWSTIGDEMELLHAHAIAAENDGFGYSRYLPRVESQPFQRLLRLNEALAAAVKGRAGKRDSPATL